MDMYHHHHGDQQQQQQQGDGQMQEDGRGEQQQQQQQQHLPAASLPLQQQHQQQQQQQQFRSLLLMDDSMNDMNLIYHDYHHGDDGDIHLMDNHSIAVDLAPFALSPPPQQQQHYQQQQQHQYQHQSASSPSQSLSSLSQSSIINRYHQQQQHQHQQQIHDNDNDINSSNNHQSNKSGNKKPAARRESVISSSWSSSSNMLDGNGLNRISCVNCRKNHKRCDRQVPFCSRCQKTGRECVYPSGRAPRAKKPRPIVTTAAAAVAAADAADTVDNNNSNGSSSSSSSCSTFRLLSSPEASSSMAAMMGEEQEVEDDGDDDGSPDNNNDDENDDDYTDEEEDDEVPMKQQRRSTSASSSIRFIAKRQKKQQKKKSGQVSPSIVVSTGQQQRLVQELQCLAFFSHVYFQGLSMYSQLIKESELSSLLIYSLRYHSDAMRPDRHQSRYSDADISVLFAIESLCLRQVGHRREADAAFHRAEELLFRFLGDKRREYSGKQKLQNGQDCSDDTFDEMMSVDRSPETQRAVFGMMLLCKYLLGRSKSKRPALNNYFRMAKKYIATQSALEKQKQQQEQQEQQQQSSAVGEYLQEACSYLIKILFSKQFIESESVWDRAVALRNFLMGDNVVRDECNTPLPNPHKMENQVNYDAQAIMDTIVASQETYRSLKRLVPSVLLYTSLNDAFNNEVMSMLVNPPPPHVVPSEMQAQMTATTFSLFFECEQFQALQHMLQMACVSLPANETEAAVSLIESHMTRVADSIASKLQGNILHMFEVQVSTVVETSTKHHISMAIQFCSDPSVATRANFSSNLLQCLTNELNAMEALAIRYELVTEEKTELMNLLHSTIVTLRTCQHAHLLPYQPLQCKHPLACRGIESLAALPATALELLHEMSKGNSLQPVDNPTDTN